MKISVKQNWFINSFIEIKFETLELYILKLTQLLKFYHSFTECKFTECRFEKFS